jgi:hypothetical protein
MATLEPMEVYPIKEAAERVGVSEAFLLGIVAKAVKAGVIKPQQGWTIRGTDLSRLGKVYHYKFEAELHKQAFLRVRAREQAIREEAED